MTGPLPREALDDVEDLLLACPAFIGVARGELGTLAREAQISYLVAAEDPVSPALVVRRGGLIVRDVQGRSVDVVAEGEFAAPSAGERVEPVESSQVVWLPERAIDLAWSTPPAELPTHLVTPDRSRIDLQTASVRTVMHTPVHTAAPDEPVRDVARRMNEARISSIVVLDDARLGIATDRDLRMRLVAQGRSPDTPIGELATFPAHTVPSWAPVFEVLVEMLANAVHHLPVVEGDRVVGMVSSNDLLELGTSGPLRLRASLDRAADVDEVAAALDHLPDAVGALMAAGTTPGDVGRVVATVTDRVQRRLLGLAFDELGRPPTPYGWVAFGSQGRREQTLHSDQDHGLLLPDGIEADIDAWWQHLAAWMVDALVRCGYARCDGGVMAVNAPWRRTVSGWRNAFAAWIARPSEAHLLDSTIAFDLRTVTGDLQVRELLMPSIATAAHSGVFLGRLARGAVVHRPPLGFFGRFAVKRSGEHNGAFDIKGGAMLPVVDIARLLTLARGGREVSTDERLAVAVAEHQLSDDLGATLRAGYELAAGLRLCRHLEQHRRSEPLDNWLDPGELEPLVRSQLRETFKAIRTAQQHIASRYQIELLG